MLVVKSEMGYEHKVKQKFKKKAAKRHFLVVFIILINSKQFILKKPYHIVTVLYICLLLMFYILSSNRLYLPRAQLNTLCFICMFGLSGVCAVCNAEEHCR